jgi:hypothetical protein
MDIYIYTTKNFIMRIFKLLIIFIYTLCISFNAFAASKDVLISDVNSDDTNMLKVFLDKEIETNTLSVNSDIKLFRNLEITKNSIDSENTNLLHLNLEKDLVSYTKYNLLSVYGTEGTIEFDIEELTS